MTDRDEMDRELRVWAHSERHHHRSVQTPLDPAVFDAPPSRQVFRRRRLVLCTGVAALVLAGGGTAAVALGVLGRDHVTDHSSARCYSKVSKNFGENFPGTTVASPADSRGQDGQIRAPIATCAEAWRVGEMQGIRPDQANPPYLVPDLVGCVLPGGSAAVFPGPATTCHELGLPDALPG